MTRRLSKDGYYLNIAKAVSERSTCVKRHYGCVIVKDDTIISTGYNGSPRGQVNCCDVGECKRKDAERYTNYEQCNSVHAEQNAMISADADKLIGSTVYLYCDDLEKTYYGFSTVDLNPVPCGICSRMLLNARVSRVVNLTGDVDIKKGI